jgi:hypothetical protein
MRSITFDLFLRRMNSPAVKRAIVVVFFLGIFVTFQQAYAEEQPASTNQPSQVSADLKQPETLDELLNLPVAQLKEVDPARINLLCAEGLNGSEKMNIASDLATIDEWASLVASETKKFDPLYEQYPEKFPTVHSQAEWKMYVLFSVLKEKIGVGYSPTLKALMGKGKAFVESNHDIFSHDSRDVFLNGIVEQKTGACQSLPAIFQSVARRLGYPVYFVSTKAHGFIRWDDGKERFNVETTRSFFTTPADDEYRNWPYIIKDQEIADHGYLKNQTAAEMLATFLQDRCGCLYANGRFDEGDVTSFI